MEQLSDLNVFDIIVISIVAFSAIFAFFKGFIRSVCSFFTWIGAIGLTVILQGQVSAFLASKMGDEKMASVVAYIGLFIVSFFLFILIFGQIVHFFRRGKHSFVDRSLGFAFGLVRGVVISIVVFFTISRTYMIIMPDVAASSEQGESEKVGPKFFTEAKTYNILDQSTKLILAYLPRDINTYLVGLINDTTETLPQMDSELASDLKALKSLKSSDLPSPDNVKLSKSDSATIKKVISSLSKSDKKALSARLKGKSGKVPQAERVKLFRDILSVYLEANKKGSLKKGVKPVDIESVKALDLSLNGQIDESRYPNDDSGELLDEPGYKNTNIKGLERLINSLQ